MNTVKSVYYGWGTLIVAGAGAYYFAKKSINAERAAKAEAERQRRIYQYHLEHSQDQQSPSTSSPAPPSTQTKNIPQTLNAAAKDVGGKVTQAIRKEKAREDKDWQHQVDEAGDPSLEASQDPAPTRHAPEDEGQKVREKSKYEASDVYRSRKGDRFS
jgi:lysyl-tRNA synthetase class I